MADYAELALRAGAQIIGGCCGTNAKHLLAMRNRLEAQVQGGRPTLNEIERTLGAFTFKDKVEHSHVAAASETAQAELSS